MVFKHIIYIIYTAPSTLYYYTNVCTYYSKSCVLLSGYLRFATPGRNNKTIMKLLCTWQTTPRTLYTYTNNGWCRAGWTVGVKMSYGTSSRNKFKWFIRCPLCVPIYMHIMTYTRACVYLYVCACVCEYILYTCMWLCVVCAYVRMCGYVSMCAIYASTINTSTILDNAR